MRLLRNALGGLMLLFTFSAHAFIDPPVLQPAQPFAGQELSVFFRLGECDAFYDSQEETDTTVEGNVITLMIDGTRRDDPIFCFFPIYTVTFNFGVYSKGEYTLNVLMRHQPFGPFPVQIDNIGTIDFTVRGVAEPVPAPTLGMAAMAVLILALLCLAHRAHARS